MDFFVDSFFFFVDFLIRGLEKFGALGYFALAPQRSCATLVFYMHINATKLPF